MITIQIKEQYAEVLEPLEQSVNQALQRLAVERANQRIAELQQKIKAWENKYGCSYDLFVYRTSSDEGYAAALNADPETSQWEADLLEWEFYAEDLGEWYRRLQSILTA